MDDRSNDGLPMVADDNGLTLSFKNGEEQFENWTVVDIFPHNGRKYVALIPLMGNDDGGDINITIHLFRIALTTQNGIEGCDVTPIPSDMEYEDVASAFEKRVNEANP